MNKNIKTIIAVILIVLIIIGIWFYKNNEKKKEELVIKNQNSSNVENTITEENLIDVENTINNSENQTELSEKDFDLYADETFDLEKLKMHKVPIILDFGADYCAPCREMQPILKNLNEEFKGKAIIKICDVTKYPEISRGYDVSLIPTQIFINSDGTPFVPENNQELKVMFAKDNNGNIIYSGHVGYLSEQDLRNILKEMK